MRAFDFILLFFSFVYALALSHLLMTAARMIRHRRTIVFSWPQALWMIAALLLVIGNWVSLWDFHNAVRMSAAVIGILFSFSVLVYLDCALVSPDFNADGVVNLQEFHELQGPTYIAVALATVVAALVLNWIVGGMGAQNWANQNGLVVSMLLPPAAALILRKSSLVQVLAPLVLAAFMIVFISIYYPVLK
ncbi:MAG TPA: hypothetical protein VFO29_12815 [Candidatus Rubrimentiphilum sp.]|nr:hypothetical protein [Candidatus Rubrimentiphilum sp.]